MNRSVSPVWPPTGIALAALILLGRRYWPGVLLGAFLANYFLTSAGLAISVGIALGNTLEAIVGAYLADRFVGPKCPLDRTRAVMKFFSLTVVLSPTVSATLGVICLCLGGAGDWNLFGRLWFTWWMGDATGALTVTPLFLSLYAALSRRWTARQIGDWLTMTGLLVACTSVFFLTARLPEQYTNFPVAYLILPLVIWSALRFTQFGVAYAVLLISAIAIYGTLKGGGPFASGDPNEALLALQMFIAITSLTSHVLAAVVKRLHESEEEARNGVHVLTLEMAERKRAEDALRRLAADLQASNQELERFAHVASHDLKEPLRTVSNYIDLVSQKYRHKLDQDGSDYIEYAVAGAKRMRELIDGLLNYSTVESSTHCFKSISGETIVRSAIENLQMLIKETHAKIHIGLLGQLWGDPVQIEQLFQNLISNSIKFRMQTPHLKFILIPREKGRFLGDLGCGQWSRF